MNKTVAAASIGLLLLAALRTTAAFESPQIQKEKATASYGKVDGKVLAVRRAKAAAIAFTNEGAPLLDAGEYDAALKLFSKAIAEYPKLPKAFRCHGLALLLTGERDKALTSLHRAVELDSRELEYTYESARAMIDKGDFAHAIDVLDFVIEVVPNSGSDVAFLYRYRGRCWFRLGKDIQALRDLDEAIRLDPTLVAAYSNRGELFAARGEHQRAIDDFTRAIELKTGDVWSTSSLNARAVLYLMRGSFDKCIADGNEAIRLDPKNSLAYQNRGAAYLMKQEIDASIIDSTKAIELSSAAKPWPFINRAIAWTEKEKYKEAIADLEAALDLAPDNQMANVLLAYLFSGGLDAQLRDARRAAGLATTACEATCWKDMPSLDVLGIAYAEALEFEKAIEYTEKALLIAANLSNSSRLQQALRRRVELYRNGKPFHAKVRPWSAEYADYTTGLDAVYQPKNFGNR